MIAPIQKVFVKTRVTGKTQVDQNKTLSPTLSIPVHGASSFT